MSDFPSMPELIPESELGIAKVQHFELTRADSIMTAIRGGAEYVPEGKYARLFVNHQLMMSDTRWERITNYHVVDNANGKVLIGGLGLGMILDPILKKESVANVTVLEKHQDVIDLITPQFPSPKLKVICADVFDWKPERGELFDVIYFDVWPEMCVDNLEQMTKLHRRYKYFVNRANPNHWMGSWCQDYLRSEKRRDSRSRW
jgi:hypothetical protein